MFWACGVCTVIPRGAWICEYLGKKLTLRSVWSASSETTPGENQLVFYVFPFVSFVFFPAYKSETVEKRTKERKQDVCFSLAKDTDIVLRL